MSGSAQTLAAFDPLESLARLCASDTSFSARFGTEERCVEWLRRARWPDGFRCPRCLGPGDWCTEKRGYLCRRCRKFSSVTAGTVLHGTRKPLRKWFDALYLVVQRGVNARKLQREIGLTYKVAWTWGHKLRSLFEALTTAEDPKYDAERVPRGPGVHRPRPDRAGPCGCTKLVHRDWRWVDDFDDDAAAPEPSIAERRAPPPPVDFSEPRWCDIFAHWELLATYFGSLSEKHLRVYLDELAFRMTRQSRAIAESFEVLVATLAGSTPLPYGKIVSKSGPVGHPLSIHLRRSRSPTSRIATSAKMASGAKR